MPRDRYLAPDIERATALVRDGALARVFRTVCRPAGALASGLSEARNDVQTSKRGGSDGFASS